MEWISVKESVPELPDYDYCSVMVIAVCRGACRSAPMEYERVLKRGKRVERWKYHWDRICDEEITHWMPLPDPPAD